MASTELCNTAWTIKKLAVENMGQDVWQEDDDLDYLEDDDDEKEDEDDDDADIEEVEEEDEDDNEEEWE